MKTRHRLVVAVLTAALGGLIVPALAEAPGGAQTMPGNGMGMGRMEHGMTSGGTMSGGMMGGMMSGGMMGGCAGMMQSMNGAGRPNSQWQQHPHGGTTPN